MNAQQEANISKSLDAICNSLVWAWRYQNALEGLSEGAKNNKTQAKTSGVFLNCVYFGMLESLIMKIAQLTDNTKNSHSIPSLFTLVERYKLYEKSAVKMDRDLLMGKTPEKIKAWRDNRIAHLTESSLDDIFFNENQLSLSETREFLQACDSLINRYSTQLRNVVLDAEFGANGIFEQGQQLFNK